MLDILNNTKSIFLEIKEKLKKMKYFGSVGLVKTEKLGIFSNRVDSCVTPISALPSSPDLAGQGSLAINSIYVLNFE